MGDVVRGFRPAQPRDPEPMWRPVRFVREDVECSFCGYVIRKGSPGDRVGERGTKAWWNPHLREVECLGCRSEAVRALEARESCGRTPLNAALPPE